MSKQEGLAHDAGPHDEESSTAENSIRQIMSCKKHRLAAAVCCACLVLIPGIVCLILYLLGYFTFQDPSIGISSVTITGIQMGYDGDVHPMLEFMDDLTGGAASNVVPSQAFITMEMILEINNTNTYDIDVEQSGEMGTIVIPACVMDESSSNCDDVDETTTAAESEDDLTVATWEVLDTVLEANSSTEIPVSVTFAIDFGDADDLAGNLAGLFLSGGPLALRIRGGIVVSSWFPGLRVENISCLAELDDVQNFQDPPDVTCRHSTNVGKLITVEGVVDADGKKYVF